MTEHTPDQCKCICADTGITTTGIGTGDPADLTEHERQHLAQIREHIAADGRDPAEVLLLRYPQTADDETSAPRDMTEDERREHLETVRAQFPDRDCVPLVGMDGPHGILVIPRPTPETLRAEADRIWAELVRDGITLLPGHNYPPDITVAEKRELAALARQVQANGGDPAQVRLLRFPEQESRPAPTQAELDDELEKIRAEHLGAVCTRVPAADGNGGVLIVPRSLMGGLVGDHEALLGQVAAHMGPSVREPGAIDIP